MMIKTIDLFLAATDKIDRLPNKRNTRYTPPQLLQFIKQ
jgi:hypothetical protein